MAIILIFSSVTVVDSSNEIDVDGDILFAGGNGTENDPYLIANVTQLQDMSSNLTAHYKLVNDIDANETESWNGGSGFDPIGYDWGNSFTGSFDGAGHEITGLYINRTGTDYVGLFGYVHYDGRVSNVSLTDAEVSGNFCVGTIGGEFAGELYNSSARGKVYGDKYIGGIVGDNVGFVNNSYSGCDVFGSQYIGGLVGYNWRGIDSSYSMGNVTGTSYVGGLVGEDYGTTNDYADINNSFYNIDEVLINDGHHVTYRGIFDNQYQDWMNNNFELDINDYQDTLVPSGGCYEIDDVQGIRDLLGFSDEEGYIFRLTKDIDLSSEPGLYVPYLSAELQGNGKVIHNLTLDLPFIGHVGMFGHIGGVVKNLGIEEADVSGGFYAGGLCGYSSGTVFNSHLYGNVSGNVESTGGLAARNTGAIDHCCFEGVVNGTNRVGGLVGTNEGPVSSSFAVSSIYGEKNVGGAIGHNSGEVNNSYTKGTVNGTNRVGGLVGNNYNNVTNSYSTVEVNGTGNLGGLVGDNHGDISKSHATGNVTGTGSLLGGLVGRISTGYYINNSYATGNVVGYEELGGLVGKNFESQIHNSYATGDVLGEDMIGGLVGTNYNTSLNVETALVENTYACGNVSGGDNGKVGGLIGWNDGGSVNCSYATGYVSVTMGLMDGGLVGYDADNAAENSFWDTETSGITGSDGGTGKTTAEMKDVSTFTDLTTDGLDNPWDFVDDPNDDAGVEDIWDIDEAGVINDGYPYLKDVVEGDYTAPHADAGEDKTVDEDTVVVFNGSGSSDDVGIVNYTWTIGATEYYGMTVEYTFTQPGDYTAELKVTDGNGNWDSDTVNVTVLDDTPPDADAGADKNVVVDEMFTLDAGNSSDNVGIVNYTWTYGGEEYYGITLERSFELPGEYTFELTVTDGAGNTGKDTVNVTVSDVTDPIADAGDDRTVKEDTEVTFDGSNSSDDIGIINYTWIIDGTEYYGMVVEHSFEEPGSYTVELEVTDDAGNNDTETIEVTVSDVTDPVADAGDDITVEFDEQFTLNGNGSSDNIGVVDYTWMIGGDEYHGQQVEHSYSDIGTKEIILMVEDGAGNTDLDSINVTVIDPIPPTADAGGDMTVDEDMPIVFDASGSSDNDAVVGFEWIIEGDHYYGEEVSYTFSEPGVYEVVLDVNDNAQNSDKDTVNITVKDVTDPTADAGSNSTVEVGDEVSLDGSDSSDNGEIVSYEWNLDGTSKTGEEVSYTFDEEGTYEVELVVSDEAGNTDTDTIEITVEQKDSTQDDGSGSTGQTDAEGDGSLLYLIPIIILVAVISILGYLKYFSSEEEKSDEEE